MKLRLAGVIKESIVDGPGIRLVVFTQGCPHRCVGCHNPHTHDFNGGYESDTQNIINEVKKNKLLSGVTLSGGEPFSQAAELAELAKEVHNLGKNVIVFSGWTFEELLEGSKQNSDWAALLKESDLLIDGRFVKEQKSLLLKFRGSKNQRIIDVKAALKEGKAVLFHDPYETSQENEDRIKSGLR